jgi:exo-beta-1,3-glucanase (GH17 family)/cellulose synthase/poly-beta-1,6-N-acetylglucosamine synthase-like glycosyltransferase
MKFPRTLVAIVLTVVSANLALWAAFNQPRLPADWSGTITGVSFNPYRAEHDPRHGRHPDAYDIDADLRQVAGHVRRVRTYSSLDGLEKVPGLAARHGLTVTAGAWLDTRHRHNAEELISLIRNTRIHRNIDRVIVGNETLLRGDLDLAQLTAYLHQVRRQVRVPVSTAEPWHIWLKYPELAEGVDFIAAHILPYWEGVPADEAASYVLHRYQQLTRAFPDKPVLIAEVGWPSAGHTLKAAQPSPANEAQFLRQFFNAAHDHHIDYFVMEAFDQPWKRAEEGSVGPHWGMWDVERDLKLPLTGAVWSNPSWPWQAALATALAMAPMLWFLLRWQALRRRGRLFFAFLLQLSAALLVWTLSLPFTRQLDWSETLLWALLIPAQLALLAVVLINGLELTELLWQRGLRRGFRPAQPAPGEPQPVVSLHLAICNEPPQLVIETLDSLAQLDYPEFEVIVVDNNTTDPALWQPVQAHCEKLGAHFRFYSLGKWSGFKAGALNFALRETDPRAAVVGVIDADYVVQPYWLSAMLPYFTREKVAIVQAPQDHRDWEDKPFEEMINWEYAGFFHIGMVHRNERNAIIQHGTMTLVRKSALLEQQGWPEWCICEDAELGLRMFKAGHEAVYVNHPFGRGLTPHTFAGYKGQRFRWAYGAVQILKAHWRSLLPWDDNPLSPAQRYHFAMGWLPWFADALHLAFTAAALFWSLGLVTLPQYFAFPLAAFLLPVLTLFGFKLLHSLTLYRSRVPCTWPQTLGAALAGMSLTHTVARAVIQGVLTSSQPFLRTPKAAEKTAWVRALLQAREELAVLGALLLLGGGVIARYGLENGEAALWLAILAVQSLPYIAAGLVSLSTALPTLQPLRARRTWRLHWRKLLPNW